VDHTIISLHAGMEFIDYPHPDHRKLCKKIASLGASLIIGHHPHVINGVEKYGDCLIAHSLGNFIFDPANLDYQTDSSQQGMMLMCNFSKKSILSYEIVPIEINRDFQPVVASDGLRNIIINKLQKISEGLNSNKYPDIYFKQASDLWPKINIGVNFSILKKQGIWAIVKRIPRIKSIYIILLAKHLVSKLKKILIYHKSNLN
jgi:poly-gamma-glutamate synthesis protein (capsule biosynthesis protein)